MAVEVTNPAGSIEQRIALAQKKTAEARGNKPPPAAKPEPEPPAEEQPETEPAEAQDDGGEQPEPAEAETAEGEAAPETESAEPATIEQLRTTANAALEKGDIDALVKALGGDPSKVNAPTRKRFRALARELGKIESTKKAHDEARQKATEELAAESTRLSQIGRSLANKYAAADTMTKAWGDEDYLAFGKALEKHCGADLATITQRLASGKTGRSPEEQRIAELEAKIAKLEAPPKDAKAEPAKTEDAKTLAQKRDAAIARTGKALEGHVYVTTNGEPDQDAVAEVFEAYERTWDGKRFTKTPKQVADELQTKLEAKAAARGLVKTGAPPARRPAPAPGKKPPAPRLQEPPRQTPRTALGTKEDLEASRAARVAQTKRLMEMNRRGLR